MTNPLINIYILNLTKFKQYSVALNFARFQVWVVISFLNIYVGGPLEPECLVGAILKLFIPDGKLEEEPAGRDEQGRRAGLWVVWMPVGFLGLFQSVLGPGLVSMLSSPVGAAAHIGAVIFVLVLLNVESNALCPTGCHCFRTTLRCINLHLEKLPPLNASNSVL